MTVSPQRRLDTALDAACAAFTDRPAIRAGNRSLTYAALGDAAESVATLLSDAGIGKDEPVLVAASNDLSDIPALYGVWKAGGVAVPVHRQSPRETVLQLAARTKARILLDMTASESSPNAVGGHDRLWPIGDDAPPARPILEDAGLIVFTSGSTGSPKGVVHGHNSFTAKMTAINDAMNLPADGHVLVPLQITFVYAQWVILTTLLRGAEAVLATPFRADEFFGLIQAGPAAIAVVPTMLRHLQKHVDAHPDFRYGGLLFSGGEALAAGLALHYKKLWPDVRIWDVYGSTETASSDFYVAPPDFPGAAGTIGRPAPGVDYRLDGQTGELLIRTPYLMRGYLDEPDLTADALRDGYFRTGDQARVGDDGIVAITDRLKNLVVRSGNKISPVEVETLFMEHPDVHSALAAGVPDPAKGEALHLMVVPRSGAASDAETLREWAKERLDRFKLPDRIHFVADLPAGRTGKTDRNEMRRIILSQME